MSTFKTKKYIFTNAQCKKIGRILNVRFIAKNQCDDDEEYNYQFVVFNRFLNEETDFLSAIEEIYQEDGDDFPSLKMMHDAYVMSQAMKGGVS